MFHPIRDTKPIDEAAATAMFDDYAQAIELAASKDGVDGVIDLASICSGAVRVYDGSLELDDLHLRAECPSLFIDGDLTVRGIIEHEFRAGFLVVFGNLEAHDIVTTSQIFVTGDLTVRGTLFGNCSNFMTSVLGHTRSTTIVSAKEHSFCFYGGHTVERVVTDGASALVDGVDHGYDQSAVARLLRNGSSILR